jgi:hypothetical protein
MTEEPVKKTKGNLKGPGPGRPKGMPNKTTALLKDAILMAAEGAGGSGGLVAYLEAQASENPTAFLSLLGKVLPMQVNADVQGNVGLTILTGVARP